MLEDCKMQFSTANFSLCPIQKSADVLMYNYLTNDSINFVSNYKLYYRSPAIYASLRSFREHRRLRHIMNLEGRLLLLDVYNSDNILKGCVGFIKTNTRDRLSEEVTFIVHLRKDFVEKNFNDIVYLLSLTASRKFNIKYFYTHVTSPYISAKNSPSYELDLSLCRLFEKAGFSKKQQELQSNTIEYCFAINQEFVNNELEIQEKIANGMKLEQHDVSSHSDNIHRSPLFLDCCDCGKRFELTANELSFYESRGLMYPKRCSSCRVVKQMKFGNNSMSEQHTRQHTSSASYSYQSQQPQQIYAYPSHMPPHGMSPITVIPNLTPPILAITPPQTSLGIMNNNNVGINHTVHTTPSSQPSDEICKYFVAGNCRYGNMCRYKHTHMTNPSDIETKTATKAVSNSDNVFPTTNTHTNIGTGTGMFPNDTCSISDTTSSTTDNTSTITASKSTDKPFPSSNINNNHNQTNTNSIDTLSSESILLCALNHAPANWLFLLRYNTIHTTNSTTATATVNNENNITQMTNDMDKVFLSDGSDNISMQKQEEYDSNISWTYFSSDSVNDIISRRMNCNEPFQSIQQLNQITGLTNICLGDSFMKLNQGVLSNYMKFYEMERMQQSVIEKQRQQQIAAYLIYQQQCWQYMQQQKLQQQQQQQLYYNQQSQQPTQQHYPYNVATNYSSGYINSNLATTSQHSQSPLPTSLPTMPHMVYQSQQSQSLQPQSQQSQTQQSQSQIQMNNNRYFEPIQSSSIGFDSSHTNMTGYSSSPTTTTATDTTFLYTPPSYQSQTSMPAVTTSATNVPGPMCSTAAMSNTSSTGGSSHSGMTNTNYMNPPPATSTYQYPSMYPYPTNTMNTGENVIPYYMSGYMPGTSNVTQQACPVMASANTPSGYMTYYPVPPAGAGAAAANQFHPSYMPMPSPYSSAQQQSLYPATQKSTATGRLHSQSPVPSSVPSLSVPLNNYQNTQNVYQQKPTASSYYPNSADQLHKTRKSPPSQLYDNKFTTNNNTNTHTNVMNRRNTNFHAYSSNMNHRMNHSRTNHIPRSTYISQSPLHFKESSSTAVLKPTFTHHRINIPSTTSTTTSTYNEQQNINGDTSHDQSSINENKNEHNIISVDGISNNRSDQVTTATATTTTTSTSTSTTTTATVPSEQISTNSGSEGLFRKNKMIMKSPVPLPPINTTNTAAMLASNIPGYFSPVKSSVSTTGANTATVKTPPESIVEAPFPDASTDTVTNTLETLTINERSKDESTNPSIQTSQPIEKEEKDNQLINVETTSQETLKNTHQTIDIDANTNQSTTAISDMNTDTKPPVSSTYIKKAAHKPRSRSHKGRGGDTKQKSYATTNINQTTNETVEQISPLATAFTDTSITDANTDVSSPLLKLPMPIDFISVSENNNKQNQYETHLQSTNIIHTPCTPTDTDTTHFTTTTPLVQSHSPSQSPLSAMSATSDEKAKNKLSDLTVQDTELTVTNKTSNIDSNMTSSSALPSSVHTSTNVNDNNSSDDWAMTTNKKNDNFVTTGTVTDPKEYTPPYPLMKTYGRKKSSGGGKY